MRIELINNNKLIFEFWKHGSRNIRWKLKIYNLNKKPKFDKSFNNRGHSWKW